MGDFFSTPLNNTGARLIDLAPTKNMGIPLDGENAHGRHTGRMGAKKAQDNFSVFSVKSKQYFSFKYLWCLVCENKINLSLYHISYMCRIRNCYTTAASKYYVSRKLKRPQKF